jgi:hypothetical protein
MFLSPEIEPMVELSYSFSWLHQTTSTIAELEPPYSAIQGTSTSHSHSIGIGVGGAYNIRLNGSTLLFAGAIVRVAWNNVATSGTNISESSKWFRPATTFPVIFCGGKFFLSPQWALVAKIEYSHQSTVPTIESATGDHLSLAGGFSVFL